MLMATPRSSVRAFASDTASPGEILRRLSRLVDLQRDGQFATVLRHLDPVHMTIAPRAATAGIRQPFRHPSGKSPKLGPRAAKRVNAGIASHFILTR